MADHQEKRIVDLSHVIEHGMTTFPGLPGPHICDFWTREGSAANYDDGSSFQIGRIDMVANTGTYVDSPSHRYADGVDLADLPLESLADLPAIVVRRPWDKELGTDAAHFEGLDVRGKAVLVHTGERTGMASTIASSPPVPPTGWSTTAPPWSASTATISTTRARGRGRFTASCSSRTSRSASI